MCHRFALLFCLFATLVRGAEPPQPITFTAYNLENYLVMERPDANWKRAPKPEKEVVALVRILSDIRPDILGVCEIGDRDQLHDLQKRLAAVGLHYTDSEIVADSADTVRHLALLSRFPIVARHSDVTASYDLNGVPMRVQRGFLDVTVQITDAYALRLVGVHLKSKRPVPEGEALMRRNEAHLLRRHIDKILEQTPTANLLVYGDFNDTKNQPSIQEIRGVIGTPTELRDLDLRDRLGDKWTHYWRSEDVYARIDFLFANAALLPEIVHEKCRLYRSAYWNDASDHRPAIAVILPVEK